MNLQYGKNKGFTLVELSLVVVIIGFIVVAITSGAALVRAARVKSVMADYKKYVVSSNSFVEKYNGLPGDFSKAGSYAIGNDGNGDGKIFHENSEVLYAWQHLAASGYVDGSYTGADAGPIDNVIGVNLPPTSFGDDVTAIYTYLTPTVVLGDDNCVGTYNKALFGQHININIISFGRLQDIADNCPVLPFLEVKEAYAFDNKFDDGKASTGDIFAANEDNTNVNGNRCVDNSVRGTGGADYDFDEEGETCRLIFTLGF